MFEGVYTALITPFTEEGSVDTDALRELVANQIDAGVAGLVPMGTTGESPTVTHAENIEVVRLVVDEAGGRVPVIAGTGSNSTQEAIDMTKLAKDIGADASLQVTPYYNKPSQEGLYRHFTAIADAADLPIVVYNIQGRTGRNVENETMLRLAEHPRIVAVKEASGDLNQIMDLVAAKPDDFVVLSGDDNLALPITLLGGRGVVSVASNLIPERMAEMIRLARDGNVKKSVALHYELLPLFRALFFDTNPIPVKYAMSLLGRATETYRLPLCAPSDSVKERIRGVLKEVGVL
jgi:4-hydroxy-tetrahydrodipicolinate synthase